MLQYVKGVYGGYIVIKNYVHSLGTVSYTHLDVYKRQGEHSADRGIPRDQVLYWPLFTPAFSVSTEIGSRPGLCTTKVCG